MFHADIFSSRLSENSLLFAQLPGRYLVLAKSLRHFNCLVSFLFFLFPECLVVDSIFFSVLSLLPVFVLTSSLCDCLFFNCLVFHFSISSRVPDLAEGERRLSNKVQHRFTEKSGRQPVSIYFFGPNQGLIRNKEKSVRHPVSKSFLVQIKVWLGFRSIRWMTNIFRYFSQIILGIVQKLRNNRWGGGPLSK